MKRSEQVLKHLKDTVNYKFVWGDRKWLGSYATIKSVNRDTGIPISSIYRAIKKLQHIKGFSFSHGLISYEYPHEAEKKTKKLGVKQALQNLITASGEYLDYQSIGTAAVLSVALQEAKETLNQ